MRLPGAHAKAGRAYHQPSGQNQISPHQPSMPEDSGAKESLLQGYVHPTGGHNMGVAGGGAEETGSGGGREGVGVAACFCPRREGKGMGSSRQVKSPQIPLSPVMSRQLTLVQNK